MKVMIRKAAGWLSLVVLLMNHQSGWSQETVKPDQLFAMSLGELMNVELEITTAGKLPEKIAEIPASVVLIERKDIEDCGYRSLTEVLNHIPGLFPIDDYSYDGVNYGVRGFWTGVVNRNIIIMVDGVNQISEFGANFPLNKINIPIEAIDRIEVIRGPMSVVYGSGAFFGVINIITHEINQDPVNLVSASYGSAGTKKFALRISEKTDQFQFVVNASLYRTRGLDVALSRLMNNAEALSQYMIDPDRTSKGQLENQENYMNFSGKTEHLFIDFSLSETEKEMYLTIPSFSEGSLMRGTKTNAALGYHFELHPQINIHSKFSYHHAQYKAFYDWYMDHFDAGQDIGETVYEAETNIIYEIPQKMNFVGGAYTRTATNIYNSITAPSFGGALTHAYAYLADHSHLVTRAVFMQVNFSPGQRMKIVGGLRTEQTPEYTIGYNTAPVEAFQPATVHEARYRYDDWELIPRIAVLYNLSSRHIVKLLYGEAINRPSFQQNIDKFLGIQKDLEPEKIRTCEINYLGSLFPGFSAGINLFRNDMMNLLIRDHGLGPDSNYYSFFSNIGRMKTVGAELTVVAEPVPNHFNIEANLTYQLTKDQRNPDIDVAYSPNWLGYLKTTWKPVKTMTCCLTARYVDRMLTYWDPVQYNPDGTMGGRIGDSVKGYVSVGANLRINRLLNTGLYVDIRASNLFNQEIYYPAFSNNKWADRGTLGEPRTFMITLGMSCASFLNERP